MKYLIYLSFVATFLCCVEGCKVGDRKPVYREIVECHRLREELFRVRGSAHEATSKELWSHLIDGGLLEYPVEDIKDFERMIAEVEQGQRVIYRVDDEQTSIYLIISKYHSWNGYEQEYRWAEVEMEKVGGKMRILTFCCDRSVRAGSRGFSIY